jgi:WD40-like Beta Propeller Repeat
MSPDGTHRRHINAQVPVSEAAWSPDRKWIVFQTQQTLWVINRAGPSGKRVAFNGDNHEPAWQSLK